jgi:Flp pilus assembly protein TadD
MEHCHKAVQINPNFSESLNNLGVALAAKGRFDEAIENYRKAIRINPSYADALDNLGMALTARGQFDEAIVNYRKALQINPNNCDALDNLGMALTARGQFDEAIEKYLQAIQINPNRPETYFQLGVALGQSGRIQEAVAQYREALRLNPDLAEALNNLAWILAASSNNGLRNGTEAVRLAERACELTHYDKPLFVGTLAAAYAEAGRFPEAVTTGEKAEQLAAAAGLKDLAGKNRQLLELYRAGKPCHKPVPTGGEFH